MAPTNVLCKLVESSIELFILNYNTYNIGNKMRIKQESWDNITLELI